MVLGMFHGSWNEKGTMSCLAMGMTAFPAAPPMSGRGSVPATAFGGICARLRRLTGGGSEAEARRQRKAAAGGVLGQQRPLQGPELTSKSCT